tara:strand:+ start:3946 stop:4134 length:189 start_codon:yes stop_codon:yes gene_type:complete
MDTENKYATYWYKNQDGDIEPIEVDTQSDPPDTITMPTANGVIDSFTLVDEGFYEFDTIFDD